MKSGVDLQVPFWRMGASPEQERELGEALQRVIRSGWFILGPEVEAFETEIAEFLNVAHAIGVGSGTDALSLALMSEGIGAGDEVITSPMTAAFTALSITQIGATPVFADVDPQTLLVTAESIAGRITAKTKAILPVHLYGHVADMDAIGELAASHRLPVIEDSCQAHGARRRGRLAGTIGSAGAFSFYPTKNLGCLGDGGLVVTRDPARAETLRRLRNGGQQSRYRHVLLGINSRLDEMQAAVLRIRLKSLEVDNRRRSQLAARYLEAFASLPLRVIEPGAGVDSAWHLFVVRTEARERLAEHLTVSGVGHLIHYPIPVHRQPAFTSKDDCPEADAAASSILSLPLYPSMEDAEQERVVNAVISFFE